MEDSNKTVPSCSSPKRSSPGNNENLSESQRNSHSNFNKNKHFMTPTISAAIKHTTHKKNILKEPKSDVPKPGNPQSASRKSLPKTPSPENVIPSDVVGTSIDDSCAVPYDPLTNYLSPRPRFLRYQPHRNPELVEKCESSDSDISLNQENEMGDEIVEDQEYVAEGDDADEIEEVFEERNWGLTWVLLKWVFVISALFLCIMCICNMNSDLPVFAMNSTAPIETVKFTVNRPEIKGLRLEVDDFDDLNFKFVSLGRVHSGIWVNHSSVRSDVGQIELNSDVEYCGNLSENDQMSNEIEVDQTDIEESIKWWNFKRMQYQFRDAGRLKRIYNSSIIVAATVNLQEDNSYVDPKPVEEFEKGEESVDDSEHSEGSNMKNVDDFVSKNGDLDSEHSEGPNVENVDDSESKNGDLDSEHSEGPNVVNMGGFESKKSDLDHNSDNGTHEIEVERIPESSSEALNMENDENVTEIEKTVDVSEAAYESDKTTDRPELVAYNEHPKFEEKESENVSINARKDFIEKTKERAIGNYGRQLKFDQKDVRFVYFLQVLAGLAFFGYLVRKFCCKRMRASSRMWSSDSRLLPTQAELVVKDRQGVATKTGEKSIQASKVCHEELEPPSPPSVSIPIGEERIEKNPLGRVIPMVKQVGELEFTSSLKSSSVKSQMLKRDEAIYSDPVEVKALQTGAYLSGRAVTMQSSCSEVSAADSQSHGSEFSSKKDHKRDVSKVMSTPPRRSTRLQNKVTSP